MDEREQLERDIAAIEVQRSKLSAQRAELSGEAAALLSGELTGLDSRLAELRQRLLALGAPRPTGSAHLAAPVGREDELAQLEAAFDAVRAGGAVRVITLTGGAGSGKTRLMHEFLRRLDRGGCAYTLFRGRADRALNRLPYALLRDFLAFRFKINESYSPAAAREKLVSGVEDWLGPDSIETAHWIGHLAGFDFSNGPYLSGRLDDPNRAQAASFEALVRFLRAAANRAANRAAAEQAPAGQAPAERAPVVALLDDLQWADEDSLDGLDYLIRAQPDIPLLVVAAARPELFERRSDWGKTWPGHACLAVAPLDDRASLDLARRLLSVVLPLVMPVDGRDGFSGDVTLPRSVARTADWMVETVGGIPLYAEELARAVIEISPGWPALRGTLELPPPGLRWLAGAAPEPALLELIHYRALRMPVAARSLVRCAAVIGSVFWEAALYSAAPVEPAEVEQGLAELLARGIIYRRETSAFTHTQEYAFRSTLVREAIYDDIDPAERRAWHDATAAWLAAQAGERVERYAAVIAEHYAQAADLDLAAQWFTLAAQQARRASAPRAAARFYQRALALLPVSAERLDQRVEAYKSLWDVLWWQGDDHGALAAAQALLAEGEQLGDEAAQAAGLNRVGAIQSRQGELQAALRSLHRSERMARSAGALHEVALALFNRGVTLYRLGDPNALMEITDQVDTLNRSQLGSTASGEADLHLARRVIDETRAALRSAGGGAAGGGDASIGAVSGGAAGSDVSVGAHSRRGAARAHLHAPVDLRVIYPGLIHGPAAASDPASGSAGIPHTSPQIAGGTDQPDKQDWLAVEGIGDASIGDASIGAAGGGAVGEGAVSESAVSGGAVDKPADNADSQTEDRRAETSRAASERTQGGGAAGGGDASIGAVSEGAVSRADSVETQAGERETAHVLSMLAMIHLRAGRHVQAGEDYARVLAAYRALNDRAGMVAALNNLGVNAEQQGDYDEAWRCYREAYDLSSVLNNEHLRLICANNLAGILAEAGVHVDAETLLRDILARLAERDPREEWVLLSDVYRSLALALLGQQRIDEALEAGLHALALARRRAARDQTGRAWRVLGKIAAHPQAAGRVVVDGKPVEAHQCYGASLQVFVETGSLVEQARTARAWAEYELAQDELLEGLRLWNDARDLFTRLGMVREVERMDRPGGQSVST